MRAIWRLYSLYSCQWTTTFGWCLSLLQYLGAPGGGAVCGLVPVVLHKLGGFLEAGGGAVGVDWSLRSTGLHRELRGSLVGVEDHAQGVLEAFLFLSLHVCGRKSASGRLLVTQRIPVIWSRDAFITWTFHWFFFFLAYWVKSSSRCSFIRKSKMLFCRVPLSQMISFTWITILWDVGTKYLGVLFRLRL